MRSGALAVVVLALAACGHGKDRLDLRTPGTHAQAGAARGAKTPQPHRPRVTRAEVAVIRGWSEALRHGHVAAAARYFALPSIVSNGTPPIKLTTRADVLMFNRTLPCGAKLVSWERSVHRFVIATFRLTDRPGGAGCDGGVGDLASTAFLIRHGHISQWLRVPTQQPGGGASS